MQYISILFILGISVGFVCYLLALLFFFISLGELYTVIKVNWLDSTYQILMYKEVNLHLIKTTLTFCYFVTQYMFEMKTLISVKDIERWRHAHDVLATSRKKVPMEMCNQGSYIC